MFRASCSACSTCLRVFLAKSNFPAMMPISRATPPTIYVNKFGSMFYNGFKLFWHLISRFVAIGSPRGDEGAKIQKDTDLLRSGKLRVKALYNYTNGSAQTMLKSYLAA